MTKINSKVRPSSTWSSEFPNVLFSMLHISLVFFHNLFQTQKYIISDESLLLLTKLHKSHYIRVILNNVPNFVKYTSYLKIFQKKVTDRHYSIVFHCPLFELNFIIANCVEKQNIQWSYTWEWTAFTQHAFAMFCSAYSQVHNAVQVNVPSNPFKPSFHILMIDAHMLCVGSRCSSWHTPIWTKFNRFREAYCHVWVRFLKLIWTSFRLQRIRPFCSWILLPSTFTETLSLNSRTSLTYFFKLVEFYHFWFSSNFFDSGLTWMSYIKSKVWFCMFAY
jgi:hypothetical protein